MLVLVLSVSGAFLLLLFVISYLLSLRRTYSIRGKHVLVSLTKYSADRAWIADDINIYVFYLIRSQVGVVG